MNYPSLEGVKLKFKLPFTFPDTVSLPLEFISETKAVKEIPKYDFDLENRIINEEKSYKQQEEMQKMVFAQQQMFVMEYLSKKKKRNTPINSAGSKYGMGGGNQSESVSYSYLSSPGNDFKPASKLQASTSLQPPSQTSGYNSSDPNISTQAFNYGQKIYQNSLSNRNSGGSPVQRVSSNSPTVQTATIQGQPSQGQNTGSFSSSYVDDNKPLASYISQSHQFSPAVYDQGAMSVSYENKQALSLGSGLYNSGSPVNQGNQNSLHPQSSYHSPGGGHSPRFNSPSEILNLSNPSLPQRYDSRLQFQANQSQHHNKNQNPNQSQSSHVADSLNPRINTFTQARPIPILPPKPPELEKNSQAPPVQPYTPQHNPSINAKTHGSMYSTGPNSKKIVKSNPIDEPTPMLPPKPFEITHHDYISEQQLSDMYETKNYSAKDNTHPTVQKMNSPSLGFEISGPSFSATQLYQDYSQAQSQNQGANPNQASSSIQSPPSLPKHRQNQNQDHSLNSGNANTNMNSSSNSNQNSFKTSNSSNNKSSNMQRKDQGQLTAQSSIQTGAGPGPGGSNQNGNSSDSDENMVEQVYDLVSMGFSKKEAIFALEKHSYNVEEATNYLLDNL